MTSSAKTPGRVLVFSGGVGGAKLVEGLAGILDHSQLSVIGNIGDDDSFHGLWVSPDIDILTYTLADCVNRETGWGFTGDTFHTLAMLGRLGCETWMTLGDKDFAVHIYRTQQRRMGRRPAEIALEIAAALGVDIPIYLPTDQVVTTRIKTAADGWMNMETYFVRERCRPMILDIDYAGADSAAATAEALGAIRAAEIIVIAPSNPLVSIGPILAVPGIASALRASRAYKVAVSPLIAGRAVKGPAREMLIAKGYRPDAQGIAAFYRGLIDALVIDSRDVSCAGELKHSTGLEIGIQNTLMQTAAEKVRVAEALMAFIDATFLNVNMRGTHSAN